MLFDTSNEERAEVQSKEELPDLGRACAALACPRAGSSPAQSACERVGVAHLPAT